MGSDILAVRFTVRYILALSISAPYILAVRYSAHAHVRNHDKTVMIKHDDKTHDKTATPRFITAAHTAHPYMQK